MPIVHIAGSAGRPHPEPWLIWDDAWLMIRLATKACTHERNRQHVTNCKVNIISGLPQEMPARIEGIATQFAGKEKPPLR
jgi:hypothetical protein